MSRIIGVISDTHGLVREEAIWALLGKMCIRDSDMVAPSHGLIWRTFLPRILEVYPKWAGHETEKKALIVYDTMWGSTKNIALQLKTGLESAGMPVTLRSLQTSHISEIVADMLTSKAVLIGSPTLNNGMLPSIGAFPVSYTHLDVYKRQIKTGERWEYVKNQQKGGK